MDKAFFALLLLVLQNTSKTLLLRFAVGACRKQLERGKPPPRSFVTACRHVIPHPLRAETVEWAEKHASEPAERTPTSTTS